MEQTLRALYRLQQIDLELDDLEAGSGDLPSEIEAIDKELAEVETELAGTEGALTELRKERNEGNQELQELRTRAHELNERLRTVRNNKEYDATSSDIESAEQRTQDLTTSIAALDNREADILKNAQVLEKRKEELQEQLTDRKETLESIRSTNQDEIADLQKQRTEAVTEVPADLLAQYDFVRRKFPDAVVKARKGACAGCFRAITPQTIVELRRHEQVFTCEHCSRILVDEELAETVEIL